jgi:regulatory protein
LLARKAWSRRDLAARLRRRGASPETATAVVAELEARGYLDDAQFARRWVESRAGARGIGPARLRAELRARGIDAELTEAAMRETFAGESEAALALGAARKRLPALLRRDPARAPARLRGYLLRRGYPGSLVTRIVRTLCRLEIDE